MIKDVFFSLRDNFKEKSTNPFLATYFIVWIIRNWVLVYSIFNFDQTHDLEFKTNFVINYYDENSFICGIVNNILWAFAVLVSTYFLLNISRAIVNLFDKQLKPWIYKKTDSNSIVLKEVYDRVRNERDLLLHKLDIERDSISKLENQISELKNQLSKKELKNDEDISKNESYILKLFQRLEKENLTEDFIRIALKIQKKESIMKGFKNTDKYLQLGLINLRRETLDQLGNYYTLTDDGNDLLKYIMIDV